MEAKPTFAPQLVIPNGVTDISFYIEALGAEEVRRISNNDGTIHVSELSINGTLFHLHEQTAHSNAVSPVANGGSTVTIGLMVDDVRAVMASAESAGATMTSPVQDYDYGYRQGKFIDPFGHHWLIEKAI